MIFGPAYWQQVTLFALGIAASPDELARVLSP
jgi:hypothetical protein